LLAFVLFIPTIWFFGETLFRPAPAHIYILLLLSGVIGIGIGDSLFFKSLNLLGAGLTAIVDCLYSPFIIGLSIIWLRESLTFVQIIGVLLIVSAILIGTGITKSEGISRKNLVLGRSYSPGNNSFIPSETAQNHLFTLCNP
jgi:drug/metabolite transporter (DMT)-like permease